MVEGTHVGLFRMSKENNVTKILGSQYFLSKFDRKVGDVLTINGVKWVVAVVEKDRSSVVSAMNRIIKKYNELAI